MEANTNGVESTRRWFDEAAIERNVTEIVERVLAARSATCVAEGQWPRVFGSSSGICVWLSEDGPAVWTHCPVLEECGLPLMVFQHDRVLSGKLADKHITLARQWKAEREGYPRVYRDECGGVRVFYKGGGGKCYCEPCRPRGGKLGVTEQHCIDDGDTLLTGPERDEYVAAARENRDAVWPKVSPKDDPDLDLIEEAWGIIANAGHGDWRKESESWIGAAEKFRDKYLDRLANRKPLISAAEAFRARESDGYPHWWLSEEGMFLVRHDNALAGWCWDLSEPNEDSFELDPEDTEKHHDKSGYRRLPSPEAAALLAKWEANRQAKLDSSTHQPELPTAERGVEHPYAIAARVVARWKLSESEQLHHLEKRIAGAIEEDRQARSGERGG